MRAAWYEQQGPAREVLTVGEMDNPVPGPGELRIRVAASGVNPGDLKKRRDEFGCGMPYRRVIPHSDGAGEVDRVGDGVSGDWMGERVWCFGAQSGRPFGTAAEYTIVPARQAVLLPEGASMEQGACLGMPGITGYRAVHAAGPPAGRTVLVRGAAGAVGLCAVQMAKRAGARVIAVVRSGEHESTARSAGADEVLVAGSALVAGIRDTVPDGVDHIVEPAFSANVIEDVELLAPGGSIATYSSGDGRPRIPYWPLAFSNIGLHFLGSDDFPLHARVAAARDLNAALKAGWQGFEIAARFPLAQIVDAHELMERPDRCGRVVVSV
ncbi:MAG: NADPH:quinone reductase [Gammaproteobacteria bacterium]|nr:NADPH:quinone reductase [Gammaproteobacteria bacterium]